jgi:tetratricopeptide (TPR) repeat protein
VLWFFITLLPVCHIFPHHELLAEHYLYLPSFGFCLIAACVFNRFLEEAKYRNYLYPTCIVIVLLFSLRIIDRNRDWKDDLTLWQKTVKTAPRCARAYSNLGLAYYDRGLYDKAIPLYKEALTIDPDYAQVHFNLGLVYDRKGMLSAAMTAYEKTNSLLPQFAKGYNNLAWIHATAQNENIRNGNRAVILATRACELTGFENARYLDTLATAYAEQGKRDAAMEYQMRALTKAPLREKGKFIERLQRYPDAHIALNNLKILSAQDDYSGFDNDGGIVYDEQGDSDKAIAAYEQAVEDKPDCAENHYNLGVAYLRKGNLSKADTHLLSALSINPRAAEMQIGMGVLCAYRGGFELAIGFFKRALDLNPDLTEGHHNLASTYYLKGDYKAALYHCDQAEMLGQKVSPELLELLNAYR